MMQISMGAQLLLLARGSQVGCACWLPLGVLRAMCACAACCEPSKGTTETVTTSSFVVSKQLYAYTA
jgi:hypothetical protein